MELNESRRQAEIKFADPEDAGRAISCPDAVLGNRFVRIFWSRPLRRTSRSINTPPQPLPRLTPAQSTMISESKLKEKQDRLQALLLIQKQKQALLDKYVAQQKELWQKLESPGLGEQERTLLKESMLALDRSIQQLQELDTNRAKSPVNTIAKFSAKAYPAKFKMDFRPGAFIMSPVPTLLRNDMESFKKILTSHGVLGNFRYDDASNSALIEYVNRQEASKVSQLYF